MILKGHGMCASGVWWAFLYIAQDKSMVFYKELLVTVILAEGTDICFETALPFNSPKLPRHFLGISLKKEDYSSVH